MAEMENDVSDCDECDDLVEEAYAYLVSRTCQRQQKEGCTKKDYEIDVIW